MLVRTSLGIAFSHWFFGVSFFISAALGSDLYLDKDELRTSSLRRMNGFESKQCMGRVDLGLLVEGDLDLREFLH